MHVGEKVYESKGMAMLLTSYYYMWKCLVKPNHRGFSYVQALVFCAWNLRHRI